MNHLCKPNTFLMRMPVPIICQMLQPNTLPTAFNRNGPYPCSGQLQHFMARVLTNQIQTTIFSKSIQTLIVTTISETDYSILVRIWTNPFVHQGMFIKSTGSDVCILGPDQSDLGIKCLLALCQIILVSIVPKGC